MNNYQSQINYYIKLRAQLSVIRSTAQLELIFLDQLTKVLSTSEN